MEDTSQHKTPTQDNFAGVPGQRPLPPADPDNSPSRPSSSRRDTPHRNDSKRSAHSADSQDVDMDDDGDAQAVSDDESMTGSGVRPQKKKKGQRFYCTDFPPCNLSFTRSEHLARHIRKHTGERPFQCHCLRRFSRLDNLRQHAQTVHVNEEIPGDSLAATGTRFQRQIRTDRVRAPGRAKSGAPGAPAVPSRGHSRNVSNSSIGSISDIGSPDDARRRPPPLAMAQAPTSHTNVSATDTYSNNYPPPSTESGPYYLNHPSPNGYSTPTSVFSGENTSPRYPSGLGSPIAMAPPSQASPPHGQPAAGHARRLSQPAAFNPSYYHGNPYHSPPPQNGPYYVTPSSASTYSNSGSMFASPTSTAFLPDGRHESSAEADWRRRTWHPGTYSNMAPRPATSGLSYYQTPDAPQPVPAEQPAAQQALRLPGIDSFDRANAPPRRPLSTMEVDEPTRQAHDATTRQLEGEPANKRDSWGSVNQHFAQLDVQSTPSKDSSLWRHSAPSNPQAGSSQPPPFTFPPANSSGNSAEPPLTPRRKKREAWYNGPLRNAADGQPVFRTSPEGSASSDGLPTPSSAAVAEYHPAIVHSNGYVEADHQVSSPVEDHPKSRSHMSSYSLDSFPASASMDISRQQTHSRLEENTSRLDALVAVATNEKSALKGH